jgi:alpha-L-rhamnosidase
VINHTSNDIPWLLGQEIHQPIKHCKVRNPRGLLRPASRPTVVTLPSLTRDADVFDGHFNPHLLLDFGRIVNAFPRVEVEAPAGTIVDLTYGQELIGGRIAPISGLGRFGDRCILRGGRQVWELFEYKNFRYLQMTVRNAPEPVKIHSVSANTYRYPMTQRGHFACSDPVLTKTWQACVNTADLCTDDGYMDSAAREKRNWLGDGSHGVPAVYAGFGDVALTARYFRMTCWGGIGDGMLRCYYPGTDFRTEGSEIPVLIPHHTLVWATRFWENWKLFAHRDILENAFPVLEGLVSWFRRNRDPDGLLAHLPYWNWLDWTPADLRGENLATNAFYLRMLEDVARISEVLGQAEKAPGYRAEADHLRQALRARFWDRKRGLFLDSYFKGRLTGVASELGNALAVLYDIADMQQASQVMAQLARPSTWIAPVTPLFAYYVMQAYCHVGDRKGLIDFIHRRYGPMVAISDTIWESWDRYAGRGNLEPAHSDAPDVFPGGAVTSPWADYRPGSVALAHCGGTPAALVLSTHVLGVRPLGAGFERCRIAPALDLLDEAEGVFPSVRGDIAVAWKRTRGKLSLRVTLPRGVQGEAVLPASVVRGGKVLVNGRAVANGRRGAGVTIPLTRRRNELVVARG